MLSRSSAETACAPSGSGGAVPLLPLPWLAALLPELRSRLFDAAFPMVLVSDRGAGKVVSLDCSDLAPLPMMALSALELHLRSCWRKNLIG